MTEIEKERERERERDRDRDREGQIDTDIQTVFFPCIVTICRAFFVDVIHR